MKLTVKKILHVIGNLDDIISGVCISSIILITVLGVVFRYLLNSPLGWVEEVSLGLFIWAVFMGASSATKRRNHVSIDIVVDELPPKARKVADIVSLAITNILLLIILIYGYKKAMQSGAKITPLLKVPYPFIDIAVPIGSLYMIVNTIRNSLDIFRKEPAKNTEEAES